MSKKINQVEPNISSEDIEKVSDYLNSGSWITEHKVTSELEEKIAKYVGREYAVAVPNGTIAIYLALISLGIKEGHKVAVPNITMIATINAILWAGATPVIVDLDEHLCMSYESLKSIDNLDAVIFVPLNGRVGSGLEIQDFCKQKQIILIEDSAHALGSSYSKQNCGSLGDASILSFTPHKIITMGQGGMVLLNDKKTFEKLIELKTFNREKDKSDVHKGFGLNFKITDLQSSLAISQFEKLDNFINIKKDIFKQYCENISEKYFMNFESNETPWFVDFICESEDQRIALADFLKQKNIETRFSYPALSSQEYLKNIDKVKLDYSENISNKILWLPSSTTLSSSDIQYVSNQVNTFLGV